MKIIATEDGILDWLVPDEEFVVEGTLIGGMEMNKAYIEILAPCSGLVFWRVSEGASVKKDDVLGNMTSAVKEGSVGNVFFHGFDEVNFDEKHQVN